MAWRYLKGAEGQAEGRSFLRFITYAAVAGVAIGVAALLLSLAIVRGFSQEIRSKIVGFGSHLQVVSYMEEGTIRPAAPVRQRLQQFDAVARIAPVIEEFVLLRQSAQSIEGVALVGTDEPPSFLSQRITAGSFSFRADTLQHPGLVVGQDLARQLGLRVGDVVTLFSMQGAGEMTASAGLQPRVKQFRITGIYATSLANIDALYVFSSLSAVRSLTRMPEEAVTRFALTLHDLAQVDSTAARIGRALSYPYGVRTIYQQYQGLFAWVNLQQSIIPLVIGVIVLVAAFNIVGTLLMMILEKTREIGVLGSLGASSRTVRRLFLMLGLLIGGVGTVIGEAIALGLGLVQQRFGLIPLPAEAYYMTTAPVALHPLDFLIVAAVTLVLCAAAAYLPARTAAHIEPVRAIRFE